MKLPFAHMLTMLRATAFFSGACDSVDDTQPRMMLLTQYVPIEKRHIATYRVGTFNVTVARTNPTIATALEMVMCHVLSLNRPDE